jgi:hypothetical protein
MSDTYAFDDNTGTPLPGARLAQPHERRSGPNAGKQASPAPTPAPVPGAYRVGETPPPSTAPPEPSTAQNIVRGTIDLGRSIHSGAESAVTGLAQLPGAAIRQTGRAISRIAGKGSPTGHAVTQTGENIQRGGAEVAGRVGSTDPFWEPGYKPTTTSGDIAKEASTLGTSILLAGGSPATAVKYGAVPGALGQGSEEVIKASPTLKPLEPYTPEIKSAIEMGTGGVTALAERGPGGVAKLIQKPFRGVPAAEVQGYLDRAEALVRESVVRGRPITRAEAIYHVSDGRIDMRTAQHIAETSGENPELNRLIQQRARQDIPAAAEEARNLIRTPEEAVTRPGGAVGPAQPLRRSAIGPELRSASGRILGRTEQEINQQTEPLFRQAEPVQLRPATMQQLEQNEVYRESRDAVLNNARLRAGTNNAAADTVEFQDQVLKHLREEQANEYAAGHKLAGNALRDTGNQLEQTLQQATGSIPRTPTAGPVEGPYEEARGQQAELRGARVNPFTQGPASKIYDAAKPTTKKAVDAVFDENADPAEVGNYMRQVAADNPRLAQEVVREYASRVFNKAMKPTQQGPNPMAGGNIVKAIGTQGDRSSEVFRAAVEALPDGAQRYQGLQRFFDEMRAGSSRLEAQSMTAEKTATREALKEGGSAATVARTALNPSGILKLPEVAQRKIDAWTQGKNLDQLGTLLTDPEAGMRFRQLLREPTGSRRAAALISRLAVLAGMSTRNQALGNRAIGAAGAPQ